MSTWLACRSVVRRHRPSTRSNSTAEGVLAPGKGENRERHQSSLVIRQPSLAQKSVAAFLPSLRMTDDLVRRAALLADLQTVNELGSEQQHRR